MKLQPCRAAAPSRAHFFSSSAESCCGEESRGVGETERLR